MCLISRLIAIIILTIVFISSASAQQREEILFGTYLPSSEYPEITYHQFDDTNLVKLGFNTIFQTVMHNIIHSDSIAHYSDSVKKVWKDNRLALSNSSFNNIVAMNGMWVKDDVSLQQVDWVKILTHSIYNIWEAEGKGDFSSNSLVMERNSLITNEFSDGNVKGVKVFSGLDSNSSEQEIFAIRGPFVYQDRNYKVTHRLANEAIPYRVNFKLKLGIKPETNMPICSLKVRVIYNDNYGTDCTTSVAVSLIYSDDFDSYGYKDFRLDYTIDNLPVFYPDSASGHFPTQNVGYRKVDYTTTKVFYEVDIPQGVDLGLINGLYIDCIKVTDRDIWETHAKDFTYDRLDSYDQIWSSTEVNSLYQNKI